MLNDLMIGVNTHKTDLHQMGGILNQTVSSSRVIRLNDATTKSI